MLAGLMPLNVSSFGGEIDSVYRLILYIVAFWFVLVEGLLLFFAVRYRRQPGVRAFYNRGETRGETAWILVPAAIVLLLDLGIDSAGNRAWRMVKDTLPPAQMEVLVTAKQFNWEFTYPGPDGKLGTADDVVIENELHVPADQVVHLTLDSKDVIHSFWAPNLRLKQDIVPGRRIKAWFEATRPGTYELACSELCGFGHYSMRGTITVHTPSDFARWAKENLKPAASASQSQ